MTDADAFLQTILDHPDDDVPRLIFADWLEEHGDGDRAEFIRAQLERHALPPHTARHDELLARETSLLRRNGHQWLQPIRQALGNPAPPGRVRRAVEAALGRREVTSLGWHLKHGVEFQRGFVHRLSLTTAALNTYGDALVRLAPIDEMILDVHYPFEELRVMAPAALARVQRLTIVGTFLSQASVDFLTGSQLPGVRSLCLAGSFAPGSYMRRPVSPPQDFTRLGAAPLIVRLRCLELFGGHYEADGEWQHTSAFNQFMLEALLRWPLEHLETLTMDCGELGDDDLRMIATHRPWPNLTTLRVPRQAIDNVNALANSLYFPALTMLDLDHNQINDQSAIALANSPHFPSLALVYLRGNPLGPAARAALGERFGAGARL